MAPGLKALSWAGALTIGLASSVPVAAEEAAHAALIAGLCGESTAVSQAGQALLPIAAGPSDDDLLWAAPLARAMLDRQFTCDAQGAVLPIAGALVDALTRNARDPAEGSRTPTLSLKSRAAIETAEAALALRTVDDPGRRMAALRTLERHTSSLPDGFFDAVAKSEADPGVKAQILSVAVAAALTTSDPEKRLAAVGRIAENPNRRVLTQVQALTSDRAYAADPAFKRAVDGAMSRITRGVAIGDALATLYNGLSFASILFMAAIGLRSSSA